MKAIKVKKLKRGELFQKNETTNKMYIKGEYVRGYDYLGRKLNKYSCIDWDDINRELFIKGDLIVYTDGTIIDGDWHPWFK